MRGRAKPAKTKVEAQRPLEVETGEESLRLALRRLRADPARQGIQSWR